VNAHCGPTLSPPQRRFTSHPHFPTNRPTDLDAIFGNEREGYVYTRLRAIPQRWRLEEAIATLEGTEDAVAFRLWHGGCPCGDSHEVQAGNRIVAARDVYGATYSVLTNLFATLGVKTTLSTSST